MLQTDCLMLNLLDLNIIQTIFENLFYLATKSAPSARYSFEALQKFGRTCNIFHQVSTETQFELEIFEKKINLPFTKYLKLYFVYQRTNQTHYVYKEEKLIDDTLYFICKLGFYDVISTFLQNFRPNINAASWGIYSSPLMISCFSGRLKTTKILLKIKEIDINLQNFTKETALIAATKSGYKNIVKLLVSNQNIDLNLQDEDGWNPLMISCNIGYVEIVNILLNCSQKNQINLKLTNEFGETAKDLAKKKNHKLIVEKIQNFQKNEKLIEKEDISDEN